MPLICTFTSKFINSNLSIKNMETFSLFSQVVSELSSQNYEIRRCNLTFYPWSCVGVHFDPKAVSFCDEIKNNMAITL